MIYHDTLTDASIQALAVSLVSLLSKANPLAGVSLPYERVQH